MRRTPLPPKEGYIKVPHKVGNRLDISSHTAARPSSPEIHDAGGVVFIPLVVQQSNSMDLGEAVGIHHPHNLSGPPLHALFFKTESCTVPNLQDEGQENAAKNAQDDALTSASHDRSVITCIAIYLL